MIAVTSPKLQKASSTEQEHAFLEILPQIRSYARFVFCDLKGDAFEDAIQECVANAFVAFKALVRRGKQDLVYPTVLARYAVAQIRSGRKVGNRLSVRDVLSSYAQHRKGFCLESLDRFDIKDGEWLEICVEDRRTSVPDQAAFRIDFPEWLKSLTSIKRKIALYLARSHSTSEAAERFQLSPGRISQLRRELVESWQAFHGDNVSENETSCQTV
jgi:hypothetical protein